MSLDTDVLQEESVVDAHRRFFLRSRPFAGRPWPDHAVSRNEMIEKHLSLVINAVNRMAETCVAAGMAREDAISYGTRVLIHAVDHNGAERGASFATFSLVRIRGAILDAARSLDSCHGVCASESRTWKQPTSS
jgi:DNA-directed RNA polymerase specialized sigma subunit